MILAIIQARVSSSRLPGKVLKPILGIPMLSLQIERVRRSRSIEKLVVATSRESDDDEIGILCKRIRTSCFRGSLNDVLDRFSRTAQAYQPEHIVRLTGDCPLIDPQVIDKVIDFYLKGGFDYASNCVEPSFPDGLDVEVFRFSVLETAWQEALLPSHREHVTPFLYQHPERFKIGHYKDQTDLSRLRWTVDNPEDFELVSRIYEALYPKNPAFTTQDVLDFLNENPSLVRINAHIERNEGTRRSEDADRLFLQEADENPNKQ